MNRRYSRARFVVTAGFFAVGFLLLVTRFAWVQVVRSEHWRERAAVRSTDVVEEPARRGRLIDRAGRVLATTEEWTRVGVSKARAWSETGDVERLAFLLDLPTDTVKRALRRETGHVVLGDFRLDDATRRTLRRVAPVTFENSTRRVRPHAGTATALLGVVQKSGEGVSGLEYVHDILLAGSPGRVLERRDGRQVVRDRRVLQAPIDGADLELTIDLHVQAIVERELERTRAEAGAHRAQAIVMDPATGDVLALAQVPADPDPLPDDPDVSPWRVMAATDLFEPGSVFKFFSAASLLRRGVCDTSTVFDGMRTSKDQRRSYKEFPGGFTIRDVHPVAEVSFRHAFVRSSNIVFATAALERLKRQELYDDLRSFGFGEYPGVGFPGETAGILRSPDDPMWSLRTQSTLAIGQEVGVSLLQLASAASAVVGDGALRRPRFLRAIHHADGRVETVEPIVHRRGLVGPRVADMMRAMGTDVVNTAYGTGRNARVEGLEVGGKTGTAQVPSRSGGYVPDVYNPTFIGFAPASDPRLVVVVVVHRAPGRLATGGAVAAPCFANIVREIAASTTLLDESVGRTVRPRVTVAAPNLIGRSVDEVRELAKLAPWSPALGDLPTVGFVVGQIPPAGTAMTPEARLQLAFDTEGR